MIDFTEETPLLGATRALTPDEMVVLSTRLPEDRYLLKLVRNSWDEVTEIWVFYKQVLSDSSRFCSCDAMITPFYNAVAVEMGYVGEPELLYSILEYLAFLNIRDPSEDVVDWGYILLEGEPRFRFQTANQVNWKSDFKELNERLEQRQYSVESRPEGLEIWKMDDTGTWGDRVVLSFDEGDIIIDSATYDKDIMTLVGDFLTEKGIEYVINGDLESIPDDVPKKGENRITIWE